MIITLSLSEHVKQESLTATKKMSDITAVLFLV